jgi:hypothetical protein
MEALAQDGAVARTPIFMAFKDAEARHWSDQEFEQLQGLIDNGEKRAEVARACYRIEAEVVDSTVDAIFEAYPYREHHKLSTDKCARDITNVSTYAIHSMLIDDPEWFKNKLLLWLKTILQSFDFPARSQPKETLMFGDSSVTDKINALPPGRQSIFETYYLLEENYKKRLESEQYELLSPYIGMIKDILAGE